VQNVLKSPVIHYNMLLPLYNNQLYLQFIKKIIFTGDTAVFILDLRRSGSLMKLECHLTDEYARR
jgi:hypothetical protein